MNGLAKPFYPIWRKRTRNQYEEIMRTARRNIGIMPGSIDHHKFFRITIVLFFIALSINGLIS